MEESYVTGLTQLYTRAVAVDSLREESALLVTSFGHCKLMEGSVTRKEAKSSTRRGWQEVRDYTQREIQSREAMVGALKEDVVRELTRLRVCSIIWRGR